MGYPAAGTVDGLPGHGWLLHAFSEGVSRAHARSHGDMDGHSLGIPGRGSRVGTVPNGSALAIAWTLGGSGS